MPPTWRLLPEWSQDILCSLAPVPLRGVLLVVAGFHWGTFWPKPGVGWVGPWDSPEGRTHGPSRGQSSRCHRGRLPTTCRCQHSQSLWPGPRWPAPRGGLDLSPWPMGSCGPGDLKYSSCVGFPFGLLELFEFIFPHKESYLGRFILCFCLSSASHRFFHLNHTAFFP